jgi:arylsulfatase A-like enzyme
LYNPEDIPQHPNFIDDLDTKPKLYRKQNGDLISKGKHLIEPNPLPWSRWQKLLAINYAEQTLIDEAVGVLLDTLEDLELSENTVIIWSADHGDAVGCHGGHFDKDAYMPQEVIRIPMAIRWPNEISSGQENEEFVSNIDLGPTFLDIAGTSFSKEVDGESLLPLCKGASRDWREEQFCETHGHFTQIVGRVLITEQYKYIFNEGDMNELYDLNADPFELNNLINQEEFTDIAKDMKSRLEKWREKTGDDVQADMIKGKRLRP